ncbi:MAG TPA: nucleoside hydrolase [Clostridia bacterium]
MKKIKLLIDTDIGADIDDALAIALAAKTDCVEIIGITTVFHNTAERARLAKKLLSYTGISVPVYAGSKDTLAKELDGEAHTMMYEPDLERPEFTPESEDKSGKAAVKFILDCAQRYQNELAILAIGPLTNIARAIQDSPDTMKKISKIVLMGGAFFAPRPEWNIFCDPEAAKIVFESGLSVYCVGTDVTIPTRLGYDETLKVMSFDEDSLRGYLSKMAKTWMDIRKFGITLHDPLALYAITHPQVLHFVPQRVKVETKGEVTRGWTVNLELSGLYPKNLGSIVFVAKSVDENAVKKDLLKRLFDIG